MVSFRFWQQWLFYTSILFALFGLVFAAWGNNPFFIAYNHALAKIFFGAEDFPAGTERFRAFIWAPLGATIAACYILLAFIAAVPFRRKELWARNAIIMAFAVWVSIDSTACLYYGVYFQIYVINFFSIMVKALPLIFTWKEFEGDPEKQ